MEGLYSVERLADDDVLRSIVYRRVLRAVDEWSEVCVDEPNYGMERLRILLADIPLVLIQANKCAAGAPVLSLSNARYSDIDAAEVIVEWPGTIDASCFTLERLEREWRITANDCPCGG